MDRVALAAAAARAHAREVDEQARFPAEAIDALRAERVLVPESAGYTPTLIEVADGVTALARACGSTGLVWAMHLAAWTTIRSCTVGSGRLRATEEIVRHQLLIAGATSEVGIGGSLRRSNAALKILSDGTASLRKEVPFGSYFAHAGALIASCRRSADEPDSEQLLLLAGPGEFTVLTQGAWTGMGMRGTASGSAVIEIRADSDCALPGTLGEISGTLVPAFHLFWAACWRGLALEALESARQSVRSRRGRDADLATIERTRLAEMQGKLLMLGSLIDDAAARPSAARTNRRIAQTNNLKILGSRLATDIVLEALEVVGVEGYIEGPKEGHETSLSRLVRDVLSSSVMVRNDRLRVFNGWDALRREDSPSPVRPAE